MTITITESGMCFGPYPADDCFHIEGSTLYARIESGIKIPEFAVLRRNSSRPTEVLLIEAKSSAPNPAAPANFDAFIDEIRQKMLNGLQVLFAYWLGRHPESALDLPRGFHAVQSEALPIKCVLVIRGHKKLWLPPIQDALNRALFSVIKTMGLPANAAVVINDEKARSLGFIS